MIHISSTSIFGVVEEVGGLFFVFAVLEDALHQVDIVAASSMDKLFGGRSSLDAY